MRSSTHLIRFAVTLGVASGLIEGVGHMVLHRLAVLDNSWYPIIWIAAIVNGALVGAVGCAAAATLARWRHERLRNVAMFAILFAASVPVLALMLKEWLEQYAIALLTVGLCVAGARWISRREGVVARWSRRGLPVAVGLAVAAYVAIEGGGWVRERIRTARLPPAPASRPDVLLVVVDTLRADHVSSYGYSRSTTPTIDRLAQDGVLFENALSTSSYTLPSHVSLLSGLDAETHGIEWDTSHRLRGGTFPVLGDALQALGYRTGGFSANTFYFAREHGFGRGFLHFDDYFSSVSDMFFRTAYGGMVTILIRPAIGLEDFPARKTAPDVNRAVLAWIGRDRERPFFAMLNYIDAHDPYLPPEPFRSRFSSQPSPGGLINSKLHTPRTLPPGQLQTEIDAYDGGIAAADHALGELLAALDLRRSGRELLVIITSDHGEEFLEHDGFMHGRHLYRETIHVPLVVRMPGRVPAGVRVAVPVSNAAVPATVMELIASPGTAETTAGPFPGPSLVGAWTNPDANAHLPHPRSFIKQRKWAPRRDPLHFGTLRSIVSPGWHYIENEGLGREVFDWIGDPRESHNVADKPEGRQLVERLVPRQ